MQEFRDTMSKFTVCCMKRRDSGKEKYRPTENFSESLTSGCLLKNFCRFTKGKRSQTDALVIGKLII